MSIQGGRDYVAGGVIEYRAFGGSSRTVTVETVDSDIKRGKPGFIGTVTSGPEAGLACWGYDDQVTRVVSRGGQS